MIKAKKPSESETIMTEVVCPNDANPMGFLLGGRLVHWMDIATAVCAQNHAGKICVTAFIDHVEFKRPAKIGDIITIKAKATRAFNTSVEVFVQAWAKKILSQQTYLINEAYFTFVALDDDAKPTPLPAIKPGTKQEKESYNRAQDRKKKRLQLKTT